MIGEIFPRYQSGAKRTCVCLIIVILRQLQAVTVCSIGPNIPMPTVCDSVSWVVDVSKFRLPIGPYIYI